MTEDREFLGREPINKLLARLAFPTVIAQMVNMLYNIVDRIYIGHIPGEGAMALTGVGVCMPIILIISAFSALVSGGGAPRASIFMGRNDYDSAKSTLGNCLTLLLVISAVLTAILLAFNRDILLLFGASENTIGYASSYMGIYAVGTVFVQLTLGLNMFITAQGFTRQSMYTVLIGAALNIILDPIFIFVLGMGVRGAALATVLSQAASCTWCLAFLMSKRTSLTIEASRMALRARTILPCIALGLATFIIQISESILAVCFNSSLLRYGGDIAVGAMTICSSTMQFALLPIQGLGQGAQPISSFNYGARNSRRVKDTFWLLLKVSFSYALLLCLMIMLFPKIFAGIFTSDPVLIDYACRAARIYCSAIFLLGIQIPCQFTFTSIGNAPSSIAVAVVRKFVLLIPLIYILPSLGVFKDKAIAVYSAEPLADVLAVTFTCILFFFQFRKAIRELDGNANKADL